MLTDSHCHLNILDLSRLPGSLDQALEQARERGVERFLAVAVNASSGAEVKALAKRYEQVYCTVGVHPLDLDDVPELSVDWLLAQLDDPKVLGFGETGLDYHYGADQAERQYQSFEMHLQAARQSGKPVIIHTREARADTLALLRQYQLPNAGVLHCFSEDWATASAALDLGYYISFSGIVTFRNADELREVARKVPAERILVETDSPYLAPVPYRGKPNLPQYVREVAEFVAELRGVAFADFARQTSKNFQHLFALDH